MKKSETTRLQILHQAFSLIYRKGYQATSVDEIIATTQVTKGAFFYHFRTKDEMAQCMIREVMYPGMKNALIAPLDAATDPVHEIPEMMRRILNDTTFFDARYGCPAINLIEEMAPLNAGFKQELSRFANEWREAIARCIDRGKQRGLLRSDVDPGAVSYFVIAGYGGIRNLGKLYGTHCYIPYLESLENYIKALT